MEKITELLEHLQEKHDAEICDQYGEPGYDQPQAGIILANWNDIERDLQDTLEEAGYSLEWSDEWFIDYEHGKAWCTQPTSYSWTPSIMTTDDGYLITPDDGAEAFIEECAVLDYNQPIKVLPKWITDSDLEEAGFQRVNEEPYENGFHPGQTDNPSEIARKLFEGQEGGDEILEILFQLDEQSQFYICFNVWTRSRGFF